MKSLFSRHWKRCSALVAMAALTVGVAWHGAQVNNYIGANLLNTGGTPAVSPTYTTVTLTASEELGPSASDTFVTITIGDASCTIVLLPAPGVDDLNCADDGLMAIHVNLFTGSGAEIIAAILSGTFPDGIIVSGTSDPFKAEFSSFQAGEVPANVLSDAPWPSTAVELGTAGASQMTQITVSGSVTNGNVYSIRIGGTLFSYTAIAGDTLATIAAALAAQINGGSEPVSAVAVGSVITITGNNPGESFNVTTSFFGAGSALNALQNMIETNQPTVNLQAFIAEQQIRLARQEAERSTKPCDCPEDERSASIILQQLRELTGQTIPTWVYERVTVAQREVELIREQLRSMGISTGNKRSDETWEFYLRDEIMMKILEQWGKILFLDGSMVEPIQRPIGLFGSPSSPDDLNRRADMMELLNEYTQKVQALIDLFRMREGNDYRVYSDRNFIYVELHGEIMKYDHQGNFKSRLTYNPATSEYWPDCRRYCPAAKNIDEPVQELKKGEIHFTHGIIFVFGDLNKLKVDNGLPYNIRDYDEYSNKIGAIVPGTGGAYASDDGAGTVVTADPNKARIEKLAAGTGYNLPSDTWKLGLGSGDLNHYSEGGFHLATGVSFAITPVRHFARGEEIKVDFTAEVRVVDESNGEHLFFQLDGWNGNAFLNVSSSTPTDDGGSSVLSLSSSTPTDDGGSSVLSLSSSTPTDDGGSSVLSLSSSTIIPLTITQGSIRIIEALPAGHEFLNRINLNGVELKLPDGINGAQAAGAPPIANGANNAVWIRNPLDVLMFVFDTMLAVDQNGQNNNQNKNRNARNLVQNFFNQHPDWVWVLNGPAWVQISDDNDDQVFAGNANVQLILDIPQWIGSLSDDDLEVAKQLALACSRLDASSCESLKNEFNNELTRQRESTGSNFRGRTPVNLMRTFMNLLREAGIIHDDIVSPTEGVIPSLTRFTSPESVSAGTAQSGGAIFMDEFSERVGIEPNGRMLLNWVFLRGLVNLWELTPVDGTGFHGQSYLNTLAKYGIPGSTWIPTRELRVRDAVNAVVNMLYHTELRAANLNLTRQQLEEQFYVWFASALKLSQYDFISNEGALRFLAHIVFSLRLIPFN